VGASCTAAPASASPHWPPRPRPSDHRQCYPVGAAHGCTLAGSPRALRPLEHRLESLPPLDRRRGLVADLTGVAARGRSGRAARLADALPRRHRGRCTPARRRRRRRTSSRGARASRGGFSTKIHVRAEGGGKPMAFALSGGECHESLYVEALLAADPVRRGGRGRPRVRPGQVVGDKGYSYRAVRDALARRGIRAVIPRRRDQRPEDRRNRPVRPHGISGTQPRGAADQPAEAVPPGRNAIRKARGTLPGDAHARGRAPLAVSLQHL
jgi:Transposase DDE domain